MKKKKLTSDDVLKRDARKLWDALNRREKNMNPWLDVIMNPENWDKLDIRVQQKSGQFKRLRKK